jgi:chromate transporter
MNPWEFFWLLLKASLFSTSGTGNLPILHHDLISRGWASEFQFAEALAIGQITPGPTGLWVISLAYLIDGLRGGLLAFVAVTLPPMSVIGVLAFFLRHNNHPAVQGFIRGLTIAVASIFLVVISTIMHQNGIDIGTIAIAVISMFVATKRWVPIPVILLGAAIAGIVIATFFP